MTKDLFIRGLDDEIHKKIATRAEKKGISLNSLLKDMVDKWAFHDFEEISRHDLILYSDEQTLTSFLKSIDYSSKEDKLTRVCCGSKTHLGMQFLKKHGWHDGTIEPFNEFVEKPNQYVEKVWKNVNSLLKEKSLFGLMFLAGELLEKKSLGDASKFCKWYHQKKIPGSTFCLVNFKNIASRNIEEFLGLFDSHHQVFIARKNGLFKIHLSEESIHKLFLN